VQSIALLRDRFFLLFLFSEDVQDSNSITSCSCSCSFNWICEVHPLTFFHESLVACVVQFSFYVFVSEHKRMPLTRLHWWPFGKGLQTLGSSVGTRMQVYVDKLEVGSPALDRKSRFCKENTPSDFLVGDSEFWIPLISLQEPGRSGLNGDNHN